METKTTQRISEKKNWFFETINKLVVCIKMWDTPLYAVNMFITHWLIMKFFLPMAGLNIVRWKIQTEIQGERRQSQ